MNTIKDTAAWSGAQGSRPFRYLDPKAQVQALIDNLGHAHLHRHKRVGYGTIKARAYIAHAFVNELRLEGFAVKNLLNVQQKHFTCVIQKWVANGLDNGTIHNRISVLRWIAASLAKPGMVDEYSYYGIEPKSLGRTQVALTDKSWSAHDVLSPEVVADATKIDAWVGMQLNMSRVFGLRVLESIMIIPSHSDQTSFLKVEEGTKGGRTRVVEIRTEEQRQVLDAAKALAVTSSRHTLCPPGLTVQQAKNRFYYVLRSKLQISKLGLGVTPHGLRHEYANDLYEAEADQKSPVRGGTILDRAKDALARSKVTADLGHKRLGITSAYIGARPVGRPRNPTPEIPPKLPHPE